MARKILLADDSVTAQNMGRKILVDAGYEVITVNNGSAALKRVNESKPDLVVLDVYMPGYSGLEVCQRLKESSDTAHIPILLTVGKLEPFKPDEARRARADAHIVKPFEASELLSALAHLEDAAPAATAPKGRRKGAGDNGSAKAEANPSESRWASRLGLASQRKKAKETAAPESAFHDFRRTKGKPPEEPEAPPTPAEGESPSISAISAIPRDITAAELDALSAAAACLDAPATSSDSGLASDSPAEAKGFADQEQSPAEPTILPSAATEATGMTVANEAHQNAPAPVAEAATVGTVQFSQEPAPVDRGDEPLFAVAPFAQEAAPLGQEPESTLASVPVIEESKCAALAKEPVTTTLESSEAGAAQPPVPVETGTAEAVSEMATEVPAAEPVLEAQKPEEFKTEAPAPETPIEAVTPETTAAKVVQQAESVEPQSGNGVPTGAQEPAEFEGPAPSEEEIAEALRLLTPANGNAGTLPTSQETMGADGNQQAAEAVQESVPSVRWIAEAMALTPEEGSLSLEAEMFGAALAYPSGGTAAIPFVSEASAVAPAIEPIVEQGAAPGLMPPAVVTEAGSESTPEVTAEATAQVGQQASPAPAPEESMPELAPAATFADVSYSTEAETTCSVVADHSVAAQQAIEQALAERAAAEKPKADNDEAPKAMAAAATAHGPSVAAPDPAAIASIVESVLADLRPKIVEEITKRLAGR